MSPSFAEVILRAPNGSVLVYGEEWTQDAPKRVAAAIRDVLATLPPARPRVIKTELGAIKVARDSFVRVFLMSGSPIYGDSELWAVELAKALESV